MKKRTFLKAFTSVFVAFFAREAFLYYQVYRRGTHQAPSTLELCIQNSYPAEEHKIRTDDGYVLTVFRIPHGKSGAPSGGPKPVILLQHGTISCSNAFVSIGPKSLAFLLADQGYDVWLGNIRGNRYGLEHSTYNTSDSEFWDFCYDEVVLSDTPAMVNYILEFTNNKKLSYLGHSLGALLIIGLISKVPEYNDKVTSIIGLAPGFPGEEQARSMGASLAMNIFAPLTLEIGHGPVLPQVHEFIDMTYSYCAPHLFFSFLCDIIYSIGGPSTHVNKANLPLITASISATSRKLLTHVGRTMSIGRFHNWNSNLEKEDYPLNLVTSPVALFFSDGDYVIHPMNVYKTNVSLPNVVLNKVTEATFNHLDFLFAENAEKLVYKEIFKILKKYPQVKNTTIKEIGKN